MYIVMIGGTSYTVYGMEVAYEAYEKAVEFADILGLTADLVDGETGEVLCSNRWERTIWFTLFVERPATGAFCWPRAVAPLYHTTAHLSIAKMHKNCGACIPKFVLDIHATLWYLIITERERNSTGYKL